MSTPPELTDLFRRTISYLRLSVTDRCNLQCIYCTEEDEGQGCVARLSQQDLLSYEELLRVVRLSVDMGFSQLRITGGEHLVRRGILDTYDAESLTE